MQPESTDTHGPLPVARILAGSAIVPFLLGARFWLRAVPIVVASVAVYAVLSLNLLPLPFAGLLLSLLLVVPATLILVPFHRAVQAVPAPEDASPWWGRHETYYAMALVALTILIGVGQYVVLAAVSPLLLAMYHVAGGATPWVFAIGGLAAALAAAAWIALIAPLALALPAIAVGRPVAPGALWGLARGNRWRLAVMAVAYPFVSRLVPAHALGPLGVPLLLVVSTYLSLAGFAVLSLAHQRLNGEPDPAAMHGLAALPAMRWAVPAVFVWLVGGLAGIWAVTAIPALDRGQAETQAPDPHRIEDEQQLLTLDKALVDLRYSLAWEVLDAERYEMATGGRPAIAARRIEEIARTVLREQVGTKTLASLEDGAAPDELLPADRVGRYLPELGVALTDRRIISLERAPAR